MMSVGSDAPLKLRCWPSSSFFLSSGNFLFSSASSIAKRNASSSSKVIKAAVGVVRAFQFSVIYWIFFSSARTSSNFCREMFLPLAFKHLISSLLLKEKVMSAITTFSMSLGGSSSSASASVS